MYYLMCVIVFIGLVAYNDSVEKETDKATWGQVALMTLIAPIFIGVSLGILAADKANKV